MGYAPVRDFFGLVEEVPLNRLEVLHDMAPGGLKTVKKVKYLGKYYALLQPKSSKETETTSRNKVQFEREMRILAGLSHENICPLRYRVLADDRGMVSNWKGSAANHVERVLLEFCETDLFESLKTRASGGRITFDDAAGWRSLTGVAHGLFYLHSRGIVHCDIKAKNVLLTNLKNGVAKLCDFNLACPFNTIRSQVEGTFAWMAPEILRHDTKGAIIRPSVDIWAFGCLIIELFAKDPKDPKTLQRPWMKASQDDHEAIEVCLKVLFKLSEGEGKKHNY